MGNSSSSALPYSIGKEELAPNYTGHHTGWALHGGSQKAAPKEDVTVFKFSKAGNASSSNNPLEAEVRSMAAQHHFAKIKTLVHPHLLRAYATLDTDNPDGTATGSNGKVATGDLIVVTEAVSPLSEYLRDLSDEEPEVVANSIAWGLVCVVEAAHFLHTTAKMSHGRVCPDSIFVTRGGDFKLGDFSLLTKLDGQDNGTLPRSFRDSQAVLTPRSYTSPERTEQRWDVVAACPPHVMDSYGMGMLIQELYQRHAHDAKVPQKLLKAVQRLTTSNVKLRPRIAPLLKCPVFADNALVKVNTFLENIAAKPSEEKLAFLQSLPDALQRGVVHRRMATHKVLPELVRICESILGNGSGSSSGGGQAGSAALQQDITRREILAVVPPLYQITANIVSPGGSATDTSTKCTEPIFNNTIIPLLTKLFTLNDRGIRGALLSRFIPILSTNLDSKPLNTSIFEPMCSGFSDSSAALRELTLKSSLHLVPFLSSSSLDKLCRYLIRLQNDAEASIRTNTVIFVGKISPNLSPAHRNTLILPAFTRAMTDTFTPCRLAALRSVLVCKEYFDPEGIAKKVLPVVVPHLVDPVEAVRGEAYAVVDAFVDILKAESERMSVREQKEQRQKQLEGTANGSVAYDNGSGEGSNGVSAEKVSGSYFSGFSSWAVGGTAAPAPAAAKPVPPAPSSARTPVRQMPVSKPTPSTQPIPSQLSSSRLDDDEDVDGWSEEEEEDDDNSPSWGSNPTPTASKMTAMQDEDDMFASAFGSSSGAMKSNSNSLMTPSSKASKLVIGGSKAKAENKAMTLAERKEEFEKRKMERMEKRMQQQQTKKSTSNGGSGLYGGRDDGWSDFAR